jgi:hypothetical protein
VPHRTWALLPVIAVALAGCSSEPATPTPAAIAPSPAVVSASPEPPVIDLEVRQVGISCDPPPKCLGRYEVVPHAAGVGGLPIGHVWRLRYEMTGVEEPVSGDLLIGDSSGRPPQEVVMMASKDAQVGAEVTGIELVTK